MSFQDKKKEAKYSGIKLTRDLGSCFHKEYECLVFISATGLVSVFVIQ